MSWFERMMARIGYTPEGSPDAQEKADVPTSRAQSARVVMLGKMAQPQFGANHENALQFSWRHPYLFACINAIANSAMGVPLRVMRLVPDPQTRKTGRFVTKATARRCQKQHSQFQAAGARQAWLGQKGLMEEDVADDHPLVALLDGVSPVSTWSEQIYQTLFHLEAAGNAYWELVGGDDGKEPMQLGILRPDRMTVLPDPKTVVGGYEYRVGGNLVTFARDEVLHFRYPHPMDDYYGLGRTSTLDLVLQTDWGRQKYAKNFMDRGAHLQYMIMPDEGVHMEPEEWERLQEQFEEKYTGSDNASKLGRLENGKLEKLGETPPSAGILEMAERHDVEISAVTGVPTPKFKSKDVNRANYEAAQLQFWSETMTPNLRMVAGQMNEFLCPRYGDDIVVEFDLSAVDVLGDAQDAVIERETRRFDAGAITLDEYRQATGDEPFDAGGDMVKRRISDIYERPGEERPAPEPIAPPQPPQQEAPEAPEEDAEGEAPDEGAEDADEAQGRGNEPSVMKMVYGSAAHQKAYDAWDRRLRPYEDAMLRRVEEWTTALAKDVMDKFGAEKALKFTAPDPDTIIDIDEQGEALWRIVRGVSAEALEAEGLRTLEAIGVEGLTFDPEAPRVLNYYADKELKVKTVVSDLHEELRATITDGLREGQPIREIAEKVEERMDGLQDWQARRIAQTETVGAMNTGAMTGIEQAGVGKEWIATLDDRVRDTHVLAMDDGAIAAGATFSNGLLHPGDPSGPPEEVINCRCAIAPTLVEE